LNINLSCARRNTDNETDRDSVFDEDPSTELYGDLLRKMKRNPSFEFKFKRPAVITTTQE